MSTRSQGHESFLHVLTLTVLIVIAALPNATLADSYGDAEKLFAQNCAVCHGADRGGYIGPALVKERHQTISEAAIRTMMTTGILETLMPPWGGKLSPPTLNSSLHVPDAAGPLFLTLIEKVIESIVVGLVGASIIESIVRSGLGAGFTLNINESILLVSSVSGTTLSISTEAIPRYVNAIGRSILRSVI